MNYGTLIYNDNKTKDFWKFRVFGNFDLFEIYLRATQPITSSRLRLCSSVSLRCRRYPSAWPMFGVNFVFAVTNVAIVVSSARAGMTATPPRRRKVPERAASAVEGLECMHGERERGY